MCVCEYVCVSMCVYVREYVCLCFFAFVHVYICGCVAIVDVCVSACI